MGGGDGVRRPLHPHFHCSNKVDTLHFVLNRDPETWKVRLWNTRSLISALGNRPSSVLHHKSDDE